MPSCRTAPCCERGLRNYWGYNTLGFFAPEPSYLAHGSPNEMRAAVRRLHAAGIEVILDVVYNHTAESEETGPTLSFRGLDNASYYRLEAGDARRYVNDTGTGNTLNLSHPRVLQMVMDSLRYWVTSYHVDGFRFDLCVDARPRGERVRSGRRLLRRAAAGSDRSRREADRRTMGRRPGRLSARQPPAGLRRMERQVPRWRAPLLARRRRAAPRDRRPARRAPRDLFAHRGRRPWASINFVASHDGFTLADAVSYVERHNEANGEDNRDGHPDNYTSNWGVEGPTDDPAIDAVRGRVKRAMLATVFLAAGTPMLLAGDEFGRTQGGNNNAYCQDNEVSWLDWTQAASPDGAALTAYVARLDRAAAGPSGAAPSRLPARQAASGARHRRHRMVRPVGCNNSGRRLER